MIVHDFVYDLQLVLGFSARKTELWDAWKAVEGRKSYKFRFLV